MKRIVTSLRCQVVAHRDALQQLGRTFQDIAGGRRAAHRRAKGPRQRGVDDAKLLVEQMAAMGKNTKNM